MRFRKTFIAFISTLGLSGCVTGENPIDPYESVNRQVYKFNNALDATVLRPVARLYKAILPPFVRVGVSNFYNNMLMIPTIANDVLQGEGTYAIQDSWRLFANTTLGVGGIFDPASRMNLPNHHTDLGLTFAKWGDKQSPYIVIPFLGPSTIRDGMGMLFDVTFFTPYPYIPSDAVVFSLVGLRFVDVRAQLLETDPIMAEAIDKYSFMRDAYLQHRNFAITGPQEESGAVYVEGAEDAKGQPETEQASLYVDE